MEQITVKAKQTKVVKSAKRRIDFDEKQGEKQTMQKNNNSVTVNVHSKGISKIGSKVAKADDRSNVE